MSQIQAAKLNSDYKSKYKDHHLNAHFIGFNKWLKQKPHYWITYCQYDPEVQTIKDRLLTLNSVSQVGGKLFYHNLPITLSFHDAHQGGW